MKVEITVDALVDVEEAVLFYLRHSTERASSFRSALRQASTLVGTSPRRGAPGTNGLRKVRLAGFPYFVHYRIRVANVEIVAVGHVSRDPGFLLDRLS